MYYIYVYWTFFSVIPNSCAFYYINQQNYQQPWIPHVRAKWLHYLISYCDGLLVCAVYIRPLFFTSILFDNRVLTCTFVCFCNLPAAAAAQPVKCEVCGTYFESRRGLSSHARLHLRQLGVALSESSGAPISLLYQLVRERDGCLPELKADSSADGMALLRNTSQLESRNLSEPEDPSRLNPQSFAESPPRPKESMHALLPSSPSCSTLFESRASEGSSSSCAENQTRTKPLWAPLETDAPIRLGMAEFWMYLSTLHF